MNRRMLFATTRWATCAAAVLLAGCGGGDGSNGVPAPGVPTLASVSPSGLTAGSSGTVTLTGTNFGGTPPMIAVSGGGVTVSNITLQSPTQATATFNVAAGAAAGPRNVQVITSAGTSPAATFTVVASGGPTVGSISPASLQAGGSTSVTINGTNFQAGSAVAVSGSGVTATNVQLISASQLRATLTASPSATVGARTVTVTTGTGTSNTVGFTIEAAVPTLAGLTPNSAQAGGSTNVTLSGAGFANGMAVNVAGSGVVVSNLTVQSPTQATATFTVAGSASAGARTISISSSAGTSNSLSFTVLAPGAPTISSVLPVSAGLGSSIGLTIQGSNFAPGSTVSVSGSGVTVTNVSVGSSSQITATLNVAANAALGTHEITVNSGGQASNTAVFQVL